MSDTNTGRLSFRLDFQSMELQAAQIPVEIRRPDMSLAAHGLTSETQTVAPGTYFVTARLPAGQEITQRVQVEAGSEQTVSLAPAAEDRSPHESEEVQHFLGLPSALTAAPAVEEAAASLASPRTAWNVTPLPSAAVRAVKFSAAVESEAMDGAGEEEDFGPAPAADAPTPPPFAVRLRQFGGNLLAGNGQIEAAPAWTVQGRQPSGAVPLSCFGASTLRYLQVLQPGRPALTMALPCAPETSCTVILTRASGEGDGCSVDIHLQNLEADTLMRYRAQGYLSEAVDAAQSTALTAENLLAQKVQDPIAAVIGAYALLRFNDLARLHDWTGRLVDLFPWLPDTLAIRAEHLARTGDHKDALAALLSMGEHGLPLFTDGFCSAFDRAKVYLKAGADQFGAEDAGRIKTLFSQLARFSEFLDLSRQITTFTGIDPNMPDARSLFAEIDSLGGLDLTDALR